jgi:uncharacterized DUF497 family protein
MHVAQFKFIIWLAYWYQQTEKFDFEWDSGISQKSLKKHDVGLDEIEAVFEMKMAVPLGRQVAPIVDEERLCLVGPTDSGKMLSVVFTLRDGRVRPISGRAASKKERGYMKKSVKRLKTYDRIEFDTKEIIAGLSRLKGARRKPTSIALEEEMLKELKEIAEAKGIPYQVLMRLLIADGLKKLKAA